MNWKFWKTAKNPTITIEIDADKNLIFKADWDKPKTEQEEMELANDLAMTIILLTNGHITNLLYGAIASAGNVNGCQKLANSALKLASELGPNYSRTSQSDEVPVPKSHQVFSNSNYFAGDHNDFDEDNN